MGRDSIPPLTSLGSGPLQVGRRRAEAPLADRLGDGAQEDVELKGLGHIALYRQGGRPLVEMRHGGNQHHGEAGEVSLRTEGSHDLFARGVGEDQVEQHQVGLCLAHSIDGAGRLEDLGRIAFSGQQVAQAFGRHVVVFDDQDAGLACHLISCW